MNSFLKNKKGAGLVEYGILVGLIAVLGISSVLNLGSTVRDTFEKVSEEISLTDEVVLFVQPENCETSDGSDNLTLTDATLPCGVLIVDAAYAASSPMLIAGTMTVPAFLRGEGNVGWVNTGTATDEIVLANLAIPSGDETWIANSGGQDIMRLEGLSASDVTFEVYGSNHNMRITLPGGGMLILSQQMRYAATGTVPTTRWPIAEIHFDDTVLDFDGMVSKANADMGTTLSLPNGLYPE